MLAPDLQQLLLQAVSGTPDRRSLTRLIHLCLALARTQMQQFHSRSLPMLERAGYAPDDAAALAIEQLFAPRRGEIADELRLYFARLGTPLQELPAEEVLIALRKLVGIKLTRAIGEIAGEVDPQYRKILRNVHDFFRDNVRYQTHEVFDGTVYIRVPAKDTMLSHAQMEQESLLRELFMLATPASTTGELVGLVFDILDAQDSCRRACPVHIIATVLREYHELLLIADSTDDTDNSEEHFVSEIAAGIARSVASVRAGTLAQYAAKGVFTEKECEAICVAARRLCEDIAMKGPRRLFDYYQEQFPDHSYAQYRANGRVRFEYVMQQVKDDFLGGLRGMLAR